MSRLMIVSADSHTGPPMEEYRPYMDAEYRDRFDDLLKEEEELLAGYRKLDRNAASPEGLEIMDTRGLIRSGGSNRQGRWQVAARLRDMDAEGVVADVVHPFDNYIITPWFGVTSRPAPSELRAAGARTYTRWLADFCQESGGRVYGLAAVEPWPDGEAAARDIRWAREHGLSGVFAPQGPGNGDTPPLWDPFWDPYWAACAEHQLPISFHASYGMAQGVFSAVGDALRDRFPGDERPDGNAMLSMMESRAGAKKSLFELDYSGKRPMWELMWGGVLDRFPTLKVVISEMRADWIPAVLAYLDRRFDAGGTPLSMKPSEYWQRNFAVTPSSTRRYELDMRHEIGLSQFMFGTDYPHPEGTWPNTLEWLRATFGAVPEGELRLILGENAVRFYSLDRDKLLSIAERIGPTLEDVQGDYVVDEGLINHFDQRSGYLKPPATVDEPILAKALDETQVLINQ